MDLANFLNSMGARVKGAGTDVIRIFGRDYLHGANYTVIPDQIGDGHADDCGGGDARRCGTDRLHSDAYGSTVGEAAGNGRARDGVRRYCVRETLCGYRGVNIKTQVYPGFPTDLQQPMSTLPTTAMGQSIVRETIFESRLKHLTEIGHKGAHVQFVDNATAIIEGVPELYGGTGNGHRPARGRGAGDCGPDGARRDGNLRAGVHRPRLRASGRQAVLAGRGNPAREVRGRGSEGHHEPFKIHGFGY